MEKKHKKKRGWLVALIIVLVILILPPALCYAYLALKGFDVEALREGYVEGAAPANRGVIGEGKTVSVVLDRNDVYALAEENGIGDAIAMLPAEIRLDYYGVALKDGGFDLYAHATALNFLPISLKAECKAEFSNGNITAKLERLWLGQWIELPLEKLAAYNLPTEYSITITDAGLTAKTKSIEFKETGVTVTEDINENIIHYSTLSARYIAKALELLTPDAIANDKAVTDSIASNTYAANAVGQDAGDYVATLLALSAERVKFTVSSTMDEFEREHMYVFTDEEIAAKRAEYDAMLAEGQKPLEELLKSVREEYKKLTLRIDKANLLYDETGESVRATDFTDGTLKHLTDENSRICYIYSYGALNAVSIADMPIINQVPRTDKKSLGELYPDIRYDLTVIMPLEDGTPVALYYLGTGEFIVNVLTDELYQSFITSETLPVIRCDDLPKPAQRDIIPAPAEGLSDLTVLVFGY